MNTLLSSFADIIKNNVWLAPFFALLAGVVTSFTPCSLSSVPLVIGYVGGTVRRDTKKSFFYSLVFALGMAITFVTLGVIASTAGRLIGSGSSIWYIALGIVMVLMALQTWEIYNFIPSVNLLAKNTKRGFIGAFITGILGGIFSSPCSTPVLVVLLAIVAKDKSFLWGILLMALYAIGHSVLVVAAGTSVGFVQKIKGSNVYGMWSTVLKITMGVVILLIGLYMFYQVF